MLHRFHDRFGTAGVVIAVIALIAALGGTALAAGSLTSKQKKEVTKIAKKYAGKPGATGPAGPAGPAGTNGTNGTNGVGAKGDPGNPGQSVLVGSFTAEDEENEEPAGEPCQLNGGNEVEVEGSGVVSYTCNGSPWTAGGTLPGGATETGAWTGIGNGESHINEGTTEFTAVSFPIPLPAAPTFVYVAPASDGSPGSAAGCPGLTSAGVPQAESRKFCVYGVSLVTPYGSAPGATVGVFNPAAGTPNQTVGPEGVLLELSCSSPTFGFCASHGLWAVTG